MLQMIDITDIFIDVMSKLVSLRTKYELISCKEITGSPYIVHWKCTYKYQNFIITNYDPHLHSENIEIYCH